MNIKNYNFPFIGEIPESGIIERVHRWLSYYGGKCKESIADFDRVTSMSIDEILLKDFIATHFSTLHTLYSSTLIKIERYSVSLGTTSATSSTRQNYDAAHIREMMCNYTVKLTLRDWCYTVGESATAEILDREADNLRNLISATLLPPSPNPLPHPRRLPPV